MGILEIGGIIFDFGVLGGLEFAMFATFFIEATLGGRVIVSWGVTFGVVLVCEDAGETSGREIFSGTLGTTGGVSIDGAGKLVTDGDIGGGIDVDGMVGTDIGGGIEVDTGEGSTLIGGGSVAVGEGSWVTTGVAKV